MLAAPMWNPPELTLADVWQPEPLQSSVADRDVICRLVVIVMFAKVPATLVRGRSNRRSLPGACRSPNKCVVPGVV